MKLGCTAMMLKQKCSCRSGWEKKHVRVAQMWRVFYLFYYWKGIVHYGFVPHNETVDKEFCLNILKRLREAVRRKRPEAWTNNTWMLYHDNALAHASLLIGEWDNCCSPATLLSNFGPCWLFLLSKVEILTKRSPISDGRGDRKKIDMGPSRHPAKHFPGRVQNWKKHWEWCIKNGGEYFEGDKFD